MIFRYINTLLLIPAAGFFAGWMAHRELTPAPEPIVRTVSASEEYGKCWPRIGMMMMQGVTDTEVRNMDLSASAYTDMDSARFVIGDDFVNWPKVEHNCDASRTPTWVPPLDRAKSIPLPMHYNGSICFNTGWEPKL